MSICTYVYVTKSGNAIPVFGRPKDRGFGIEAWDNWHEKDFKIKAAA
jgi:hypothetical protein